MSYRRFVWLLPVALLWTRGATAVEVAPAAARPVREPGWHSLSSWRQPEGLPQNSVISVIQTRDGYIWLGTKGGVARFDGVRFTVFDDSDQSRLRENEVWALAEDEEGGVWIATYGGGVSRYAQGRFQVYTEKEGLADDYATALCSDRNGGMWIGTDRGVSHYANGRFTQYTTEQGLASDIVRSIYRDRDGTVWVGGDKGAVSVFREGRFAPLDATGPRSRAAVISFFRDPRGTFWISASDGLFRLRDGVLTRYTSEHGLSGDRVRAVLEGPEGGLWVVAVNGLDRIRRPHADEIVAELAVTIPNLSSGMIDREGSLWLGSLSVGVTRLRQGHFASYTRQDGVIDDYVSTIIEDRGGNLWIGTAAGLMRFADGHLVSYANRNGLHVRSILAMLADREGRLWLGTDQGLFTADVAACDARRCEPQFSAVKGDETIPNLNARVLHQDRHGAIWAGLNQEGLVRYDGQRLQRFTTADGLPNNFVRAIQEDAEGALWIGTRGGGIARLKDGRFTTFSRKEGLVNDGIQALYIDDRGVLWIATRQGVSRMENGRFTTYTTADGLFSNFVYSFLDDRRGNLWMSCAKGVFHVSKSELADFAAGKRRAVTSTPYGIEHGLASTVAVVGHHPSAFRTRDGRLWFGTIAGLSIVDPSKLQTNTLPPPIHIEKVIVDDREVPFDGSMQVPPGRGQLEIHYTGLSFLAPEKVRFRYRLEGVDPDWVEVGDRRVAYYTNVRPGRYRFQVKGANNDDVWNDAGAGFEIRLEPHFWQTYWFFGFCALGVALMGAATQRWRVLRLQASERRLAARVDEALAQIKILRGLLPICASCKKIRDDKGYWNQMESYILEHSQAEFSHSICPDCMQRLYPPMTAAAPPPGR